MNPAPLSELLIEAPAGRHFVQLYRQFEPLGRAVNTFIDTGLRRGGSLVLVAPASSLELFLDHLSEGGLDPCAYRESGQLKLIDAEQMLGRVMRGGQPDRQEFRSVVGCALEEALGAGRAAIRAYGEMVNLLWRDGLVSAAIQLEDLWNELMRSYPVSRFCAYLLDGQADISAGALHHVCRRHSDVILGGPENLFEGCPALVGAGQFGTQIGELTDVSGSETSENGATHLWLVADQVSGLD